MQNSSQWTFFAFVHAFAPCKGLVIIDAEYLAALTASRDKQIAACMLASAGFVATLLPMTSTPSFRFKRRSELTLDGDPDTRKRR